MQNMWSFFIGYGVKGVENVPEKHVFSFFIGYEVKGVENVPESTPALFVYYHGAIPIDLYYFLSRIYLLKNRLIHTVADRFLFKIPGKILIFDSLSKFC